MAALNSLVSEAIDIVVHCTRIGDEVRVAEVVAVEDLQTSRDSTAFTITELFRRERPGAPLTWTGNLPNRATRPLAMAGYDVRELLDSTAATFGVVRRGDERNGPTIDAIDGDSPAPARGVRRRREARR